MKADRRHELRENDLALALEATRDYVDRNGKQISLVLLAVIVVFAVVSFALRSRSAAVEEVWRKRGDLKFDTSENGKKSLDELDRLVASSPDDAFVMACLLDEGREALRLAQLEPFPPDRGFNERARKAFESLRNRFPGNPLATGAALAGLATVEENMFSLDGDISHKDKARALLTQVAEGSVYGGLPVQRLARDRLAALDSTFTPVTVQAPAPPPPAEKPEDTPVEPTENP